MEFPNLGEHCQYANCNQIDFLPLQCKCGKVFCRNHLNEHSISEDCESAIKPKDINFTSEDELFKCSEKGCRKRNLHEILCPKCKKHYCIEHRFHPSCPEIDEETLAAKREEYDKPRRLFKESMDHIQKMITENIRKALQSSSKVKTASKIHLMRVKQKAIGPKSIPVSDRVYFAIMKPKQLVPKPVTIVDESETLKPLDNIVLEPDLKDSVPVYISSKWSLGRAVDSICESCSIKNDNNKTNGPKLRLFRYLDGYCISPVKMDIEVSELIKQEILVEGDKLLIEYIEEKVLNILSSDSQMFIDLHSIK